MKTSHIVSLIQTGYTTVSVHFLDKPRGLKTYTYKVLAEDAAKLSKGSKVIVKSPHDEFKVVEVAEVHAEAELDLEASYNYKWIVCIVDTTKYDKLLEQEAEVTKLIDQANKARIRSTALDRF